MSPHQIGLVSLVICMVGPLPYTYRVLQGKIRPQIVSWLLWSFIGLALLLTYRSAGAGDNIWPAVAGFVNPTLIALLALWRRNGWGALLWSDYLCGAAGLASLALWAYVHGDQEAAQYALYLAIFADLCAAIPTIRAAYLTPEEDRPYAWFIWAVGVFISLFAITDYTFTNFAYPVYMIIGASSVALLLARYRIQERCPITEWI